ncbi:hypothetical protein HB837_15845, partial [Listeria innocua]|uniref:leucine-rich repeat domain-containing protein n=1 Tax=Listeria innocua TaxID=1642 RepID=UPI0018010AFD
LDLSSNQINDLGGLPNLANLNSLDLSSNQINDLGGLPNLANLNSLDLSSNQINDLGGLPNLANLDSLNLSSNQINDLEKLQDLPSLANLFSLDLSSNQISDLSPLGSLNMTGINLILSDNQISDLSPLSGFDQGKLPNIEATNQRITLETSWANRISLSNIIKDLDGELIEPDYIDNNGEYVDSAITWAGLSNINQNVSYSWDVFYGRNLSFSGTITVDIEAITSAKIFVDDDGNSQTTGDRTILGPEIEIGNVNSIEDIYTYAKNELNGTEYGLLDIQDSDGSYVIIVSQVGSLKKEDVNGAAIGTDKAYTPTYEVIGTDNNAQLDVSYGATIDSAPGYVYIYEKNTPQEVRYVPGDNINIPLTDTNGNGKFQWQEDYTVVQYQRAGGLNPTTPDGSQVPGGTIAIPDDAIEGDLITLPDTITGSDGKEYGVDPNVVDTDPNTPGVQITLTGDDQDIPYFDIVLSESESASASLSESESLSQSESESSSLSESESASTSTSESIEQSMSESVEQSTSESIEQSTSESVEQSTSESIEQSTSESVEQSTSESIEQSTSESVEQSTSESIEQSTSESVEQSTSESIEQSTSESVEQSTSESIEQSTSESVEQSTSESIEQSTSESV